jgi:hypothetical protein
MLDADRNRDGAHRLQVSVGADIAAPARNAAGIIQKDPLEPALKQTDAAPNHVYA